MSAYFEKLVLRTRGRKPAVVSKLETMLAAADGNHGVLPELAASTDEHDGAPAALVTDEAPASGVANVPVNKVESALPVDRTASRAEPRMVPSARAILAAARAQAGLTLSTYLARRRR